MVLTFSFCNTSVIPLRKEPSHKAEQTSQVLFGEKAEVLEINEKEWARIRCEWDGYEGWCRASQLAFISRKEYRKEIKYMSGRHTDKLVFEDSEMWVPIGCDLFGLKGGKIALSNRLARYKGKKQTIKKAVIDCNSVKAAALLYMNAPYQWGGRTIAGIDCSGLTQMVFKLCNKPLPRDASQQAQEGETVDFLQNSQCGDLAFFDNPDGKIVHVGILLEDHRILHATDTTGHVVIDRVDQGGIISTTLKKRTHSLRFVKRYFQG